MKKWEEAAKKETQQKLIGKVCLVFSEINKMYKKQRSLELVHLPKNRCDHPSWIWEDETRSVHMWVERCRDPDPKTLPLPPGVRLGKTSPMCASSSLSDSLCAHFLQSHKDTGRKGEWRCGWTCHWRWSQEAESPNCNTKEYIWERNRLFYWLQAANFSRKTKLLIPSSPTQNPVNLPKQTKPTWLK